MWAGNTLGPEIRATSGAGVHGCWVPPEYWRSAGALFELFCVLIGVSTFHFTRSSTHEEYEGLFIIISEFQCARGGPKVNLKPPRATTISLLKISRWRKRKISEQEGNFKQATTTGVDQQTKTNTKQCLKQAAAWPLHHALQLLNVLGPVSTTLTRPLFL